MELKPDLPMYRGESANVKLTLRLPRAGDPGTGEAPKTGPSVGSTLSTVAATPWMRARLTGAGFAIKATSLADVQTGATREAHWTWEVTPDQDGPRRLTALAVPLLKVGDLEETYGPLSAEVSFEVQVRGDDKLLDWAKLADLLAREWAKALGGLTILVVAMWGLWRAVRGKPAKPPADETKSGAKPG